MTRRTFVSIHGNPELPDPQSICEDVCDSVAREEEYARCLAAIRTLPELEREALLKSNMPEVGEKVAGRTDPRPGPRSREIANRRTRALYYLRQVLGATR
jgi:hypothetical protein